jgi:hypothetical protein
MRTETEIVTRLDMVTILVPKDGGIHILVTLQIADTFQLHRQTRKCQFSFKQYTSIFLLTIIRLVISTDNNGIQALT